MGANDGFTPDENISPKDKLIQSIFNSRPIEWNNSEQPLTHHQQAVKDFMVVLIGLDGTRTWTPEELSNKAHKLSDAFINQINKKP